MSIFAEIHEHEEPPTPPEEGGVLTEDLVPYFDAVRQRAGAYGDPPTEHDFMRPEICIPQCSEKVISDLDSFYTHHKQNLNELLSSDTDDNRTMEVLIGIGREFGEFFPADITTNLNNTVRAFNTCRNSSLNNIRFSWLAGYATRPLRGGTLMIPNLYAEVFGQIPASLINGSGFKANNYLMGWLADVSGAILGHLLQRLDRDRLQNDIGGYISALYFAYGTTVCPRVPTTKEEIKKAHTRWLINIAHIAHFFTQNHITLPIALETASTQETYRILNTLVRNKNFPLSFLNITIGLVPNNSTYSDKFTQMLMQVIESRNYLEYVLEQEEEFQEELKRLRESPEGSRIMDLFSLKQIYDPKIQEVCISEAYKGFSPRACTTNTTATLKNKIEGVPLPESISILKINDREVLNLPLLFFRGEDSLLTMLVPTHPDTTNFILEAYGVPKNDYLARYGALAEKLVRMDMQGAPEALMRRLYIYPYDTTYIERVDIREFFKSEDGEEETSGTSPYNRFAKFILLPIEYRQVGGYLDTIQ